MNLPDITLSINREIMTCSYISFSADRERRERKLSRFRQDTDKSLSLPSSTIRSVHPPFPAILRKHQAPSRFVGERTRIFHSTFLVASSQLSQSLVDVLLFDYKAGLGAPGFGAEFGAEAVEVEFAGLVGGVGLELGPGGVVRARATKMRLLRARGTGSIDEDQGKGCERTRYCCNLSSCCH